MQYFDPLMAEDGLIVAEKPANAITPAKSSFFILFDLVAEPE